ncbi:MAG TPA: FAD binding domain-containing protein [Thermomicrobiales bacterium]|nr:FAD binding domain-containing protein [Thermomicrobiales bacterium]
MLAPIEIHAPRTVPDASALLRQHGDEAAVYAGGTELLIVMKERLTPVNRLIDIKQIAGLREIAVDEDGTLTIGALATHREISRSPLVQQHSPYFSSLERIIANTRVRAAGTLGGNLCFAEPHSDPATLLSAVHATVRLESSDGSRELQTEEFFRGLLETDRRPDEIMTRIALPKLWETTGVSYQRFKTHERPVATVAAAVSVTGEVIDDARVFVGSVGPKPQRMTAVEDAIRGQQPGPALFQQAALLAGEAAEIDEEGFESADYKRHLVAVYVQKALQDASDNAKDRQL